jgi:hypothetical protein
MLISGFEQSTGTIASYSFDFRDMRNAIVLVGLSKNCGTCESKFSAKEL